MDFIVILLFIIVFASTLIFRNEEWILTLIHLTLLLILSIILKYTNQQLYKVCMFGILISIAIYICIEYEMFKFYNTKYKIPVWCPVTFAISGIFLNSMMNYK